MSGKDLSLVGPSGFPRASTYGVDNCARPREEAHTSTPGLAPGVGGSSLMFTNVLTLESSGFPKASTYLSVLVGVARPEIFEEADHDCGVWGNCANVPGEF
jgi:hypothetical protein